MNFLVTVMCLAHVHPCPIPNGYKSEFKAASVHECVVTAKTTIAYFGYKESDYRLTCEKR
jgi:hypothetical protein